MNFIKHLNAVFQQFSKDSRLNPTHISLYIALFQFWNLYRFPEIFYINREEVMKLAKIGSKSTYHQCLKGLDEWKYIHYLPSHNPYKGSRIKMFVFRTGYGESIKPVEVQELGQASVSNTNINKHNKENKNFNKRAHPRNENEVFDFFKLQDWPDSEAMKFYNYYNGIDWRVGGRIPIKDWQSTATSWMLKSKEMKTFIPVARNEDNLKTSKNKNYDTPL